VFVLLGLRLQPSPAPLRALIALSPHCSRSVLPTLHLMGHPHQVQHHRRLGLFDSAPGQWQTGCHAPTPRLFRRTSQPQHSHWPRTSMSPSSFSSACDHSLPVFTADGSSSPSAVADRGSKCRPKDMSRRDGSSPRSRTSCCWSAAFIVRGDRRQPHGSFLTPRWRGESGANSSRPPARLRPLKAVSSQV
jgi:hypothetical protein